MFNNGLATNDEELPEFFAGHFETKIEKLTENVVFNPNVYNGVCKLFPNDNSNSVNFMTMTNIRKAILSIKKKNSEGDDRIPQRILIDGIDILLPPLTRLFTTIYMKKQIPEKWKMSKITPVHKKGAKNDISNYRPVANLCSGSKIYEKLILQRIQEIQDKEEIDYM